MIIIKSIRGVVWFLSFSIFCNFLLPFIYFFNFMLRMCDILCDYFRNTFHNSVTVCHVDIETFLQFGRPLPQETLFELEVM